MTDVVALGELLIDFALESENEDGFPTMAANPGGAPANFLTPLSKYGFSTAFIGKVGDDVFGRKLKAKLESVEINTDGVILDPNVFTTLAFVTIDKNGDREFSFARKPGADTCISVADIDVNRITDTKVFHFGTLSMTDSPAKEATHFAVRTAKDNGVLISFDPNLREPLWSNLEDAKEAMRWGIYWADVVKISDNEVKFLFGLDPIEGCKKILDELDVKLVFVTCGADGCIFGNKNAIGKVDAVKNIKAIDTTGAGDIFGGSAMTQILRIGKDPGDLNEEELREITQFACAAAGLSTQKYGGISSVPRCREVLELVKNNY